MRFLVYFAVVLGCIVAAFICLYLFFPYAWTVLVAVAGGGTVGVIFLMIVDRKALR